MSTYGVGVIGLHMGRRWAQAAAELAGAALRCVCDLNLDLAKELAEQNGGCDVTQDAQELIDRDDVDIVAVATPDHLHEPQCVAALQAGKHVICEKPLALTREACSNLLRAAEQTDRRFMVGQVCRYAPGFAKAKELVVAGEIGELTFVESEYAHDYSNIGGEGGWRKDPAIARPGFVGGACHAVDLLRWIAGDPMEVCAYASQRILLDWPTDDYTIAIYKLPDDVLGKIFGGIAVKRPYTMRTVVYGTRGTIICDNRSPAVQVTRVGKEDTQTEWTDIPVDIASHNVTSEMAEFIACLREGRPPATDLREGVNTVVVCLASVQAAREGSPISIDYAL